MPTMVQKSKGDFRNILAFQHFQNREALFFTSFEAPTGSYRAPQGFRSLGLATHSADLQSRDLESLFSASNALRLIPSEFCSNSESPKSFPLRLPSSRFHWKPLSLQSAPRRFHPLHSSAPHTLRLRVFSPKRGLLLSWAYDLSGFLSDKPWKHFLYASTPSCPSFGSTSRRNQNLNFRGWPFVGLAFPTRGASLSGLFSDCHAHLLGSILERTIFSSWWCFTLSSCTTTALLHLASA